MDEKRKKMILDFMKEDIYRPMRFRELCGFFGVPKNDRSEFKEVLDSMISDGSIALTAQHTYKIPEPDVLTGTFSSTARGFGFVSVPGMDKDIFIPPDETLNAFNGDTVEVRIYKRNDGTHSGSKNSEGIITRIVKRNEHEIIGVFQKSKYFGFVVPDDVKTGKDIFIPKSAEKNATTGSRVSVKITDYGTRARNPQGEITQVLGMADDPKTDLISVMRTFDLPEDFPEDTAREAENAKTHLDEEDIKGRRDLRDLMTITVDGEDALDLDDAVTLSRKGENYLLGVHIADVTAYVKEGSALDREAFKRGTSVYLINRVVPMLPRELSNGICSLNEGQDRLTLSCLMEIDRKGEIVSNEICESVINVNHRMSYTQVAALLEDKNTYDGRFDDVVETICEMREASECISKRRKERGSIDFDFPESKITLDENDFPVDIRPYNINEANIMIENFMLSANETVAQNHFWEQVPFVYRSHEAPDADRIRTLASIIRNRGYSMKVGRNKIYPGQFQQLLGRIKGSDDERFISRLVLRSMKRARYTTENLGHFGLALPYYCHFTSPIRRYPDLQIHRIIKENMHGQLDEERISHYNDILPEVARHSSDMERKADEAEREIEKIKKMEYMSGFKGQSFDGIISGITNRGMYVSLENTCEGLVRLETLDDYYVYDEAENTLNGLDHGRTFTIGDRVTVTVDDVDTDTRNILFSLKDEEGTNGRKKRYKARSK